MASARSTTLAANVSRIRQRSRDEIPVINKHTRGLQQNILPRRATSAATCTPAKLFCVELGAELEFDQRDGRNSMRDVPNKLFSVQREAAERLEDRICIAQAAKMFSDRLA